MSSTKQDNYIAIIDCNNFYVSCERIFNPKIKEKPTVVLSNNDGCVIARSQEVKDLGVKMGTPIFLINHLVEIHNINVYSSNFALYGDISNRIMSIIKDDNPDAEIYSIDEAFISINSRYRNPKKYCLELIEKIYQWTGIPVSISLDTLNITDSFYIDNFSTRFVSDSINGTFAGLFMGAEPVTGSFGSENGYRFAEILSNDAGAFLQAAGLIKRGAEGKLNLRINRNADGIKGRLFTESLKIYDLPALAKLLQSLSIIGLLEQMLGQGLFLSESEINFRLDDKQYIIDRASFFGPSLGISLDGYLNRKDRLLDFQGVFSPIYAINSIGSVLTRKGEGLIGINFDLWGNPDTPKVLVNPFSVLTPGMFREIFRRPPPKVETD